MLQADYLADKIANAARVCLILLGQLQTWRNWHNTLAARRRNKVNKSEDYPRQRNGISQTRPGPGPCFIRQVLHLASYVAHLTQCAHLSAGTLSVAEWQHGKDQFDEVKSGPKQ